MITPLQQPVLLDLVKTTHAKRPTLKADRVVLIWSSHATFHQEIERENREALLPPTKTVSSPCIPGYAQTTTVNTDTIYAHMFTVAEVMDDIFLDKPEKDCIVKLAALHVKNLIIFVQIHADETTTVDAGTWNPNNNNSTE
jgi:hypothetical protein